LNRTQRILLPSIADLVFAGLIFTRLQPTLFHDADTGWHLWAGSALLEHGPGRIADALSFTRGGTPWADPEWLGDVLFALLFRHGAFTGVALLAAVAYAATFAGLYRILFRESGDAVAGLAVTVLAAQVTLIHLLARPLVLSFPVFLAVATLVRRPSRPRNLWLLPVLTALWANLHPSAYLAPAMALYGGIRTPCSRTGWTAAALSVAALGATPWGFGWLGQALPGTNSAAYLARINEWTAPQFNEFRFLPMLLAVLLSFAARRGRPPLSRWESVWGLGWLAAGLVAARLAPYAILAWAPFLARDLAGGALFGEGNRLRAWWQGLSGALSPMEARLRPRVWPVLVGTLALVLAPALAPAFPEVAAGFPADRFPKEALARADAMDLGPRVFNHYGWGGYVSWESGRRYKVAIDGRLGFFGRDLFRDYLSVFMLRPGWDAVLRSNHPDWLLFPPDAPVVTAAPLTGRWRLAYEDETAAVLVPVSAD
jgi:hypothetical protein